jgi:hypothetical protein
MPGARCARSLACKMKKAHERSHHGHTGNHPAFPAQWFYGLLRALPGDHACLTPSPALLIADLTPALGRQNDTTWPYASASFVRLAIARLTPPRPPHPAPNVRDDREAPLLWARDPLDMQLIWVGRKQKYFCKRGLTRFLKIRSDLPVGQFSHSCHCEDASDEAIQAWSFRG